MTLNSSDLNRTVFVVALVGVFNIPAIPNFTWLFPWVAMLLLYGCVCRQKWCLIVTVTTSIFVLHAHVFTQKIQWATNTGTNSIISAEIDSYFHENPFGVSGIVRVSKIDGKALPWWSQPRVRIHAESNLYEIDEVWQLAGKFTPISGQMNRFGYDKELHFFSQGVVAEFKIDASQPMRLTEWHSWRHKIRSYFESQLSGSLVAPVAIALAFGDRQGIEDDLWQIIVYQGVAHLFAISGLHIGLAFATAYFAVWFVIPIFRLPLYSASMLGMVSAIGLAYLSGFSLPSQRALIMLGTFTLFAMLRVNPHPMRILSIAVGAILIITPFSLWSSSFWLSFAAVWLLLSTRDWWLSANPLYSLIKLQLILFAGLMPLMLILFGGVSGSGLFINLLCVPLVSMVVMPLLLAALTMSAATVLLSGIAHWIESPLEWCMLCLEMSLKLLVWFVTAFPSWWFSVEFIAALGCLAIAMMAISKLRVGAVFLSCLLLARSSPIEPAPLRMILFDVGHGLAAYVETPQLSIIYDTGRAWDSGSFARFTIAPYFRWRGHSKPLWLMISHDDHDHAGAANWLANELQPIQLVSPNSKLASLPCNSGFQYQLEQTGIAFLWPPRQVSRAYNPHSCVVKVSFQGKSILLTGDIDKRAEFALMQQLDVINRSKQLSSTVITVPHHGSESSSSYKFIEATSAKVAVSGNDFQGQWDLPSSNVVNRYRASNALWLDTGVCGAIELEWKPTVSGGYWQLDSQRSYQPWFRWLIRGQVNQSNRACYRQVLQ